MDRVISEQRKLTGTVPCVFRPPYGDYDTRRSAEQEGDALANPVVLMHNSPAGNPATALALPRIIAFFRHHHYRFVNLLGAS
jgi:peptidoglycan/xylan/chitin deacetylase (PgdA/CDA1 family)